MKRKEWSEEQLEQLLQQLPLVKDKQTPEGIYNRIVKKQQKKKISVWIAPTFATVTALLLLSIITPYIFQSFIFNQESSSSKDLAISQEESTEAEVYEKDDTEGNMAEAKLVEEVQIDQELNTFDNNNDDNIETFVTNPSEAEEIITVGFTDGNSQNIIPVSVDTNTKQNNIENIGEIISKVNTEELGLIGSELIYSTLIKEKNPQEIGIEYHGKPVLTSKTEVLYHEAIEETFRWLDYKKAKLYTNDDEGIEFSTYGNKTELNLNQASKRAYFLYQFDEQTSKLLAPSPGSYETLENAFNSMKIGIEKSGLKPTIMENITKITTIEIGELLEIEFIHDTEFKNNEDTIIMLEAILLTAKEFGYNKVQFKGIDIDQIGVMDLTNPVDVPYSPNPIKAS